MRVPTVVGELDVEEHGPRDAPAVVLWHSFLHHGGMWRGAVERLRDRHRLISIDAPGHGRSPILDRPIDLEACGRAVHQVLDACAVERAAFAGLSWGGMVAIDLALRDPSRLTALILLDTSARAERPHRRLRYVAMGTFVRALGVPPFFAKQIEPLFFGDETIAQRRELIDAFRAHVVRLDRRSIWHALHCIFDRKDRLSELDRVTLPTLVICGADDRAQPVEESELIARAMLDARLVVIPRAGHLSVYERPAEVSAVIARFLDGVHRRASAAA
jgi:3-oxoadipate enol-lactonase